MHAEDAYLFSHPLLREAAYQLHLPSQRARLHELALGVLERLAGGSREAIALELADHARAAQDPKLPAKRREELAARELEYLQLARSFARRHYRLSEHMEAAERLLAQGGLAPLERVALLREWAELNARSGKGARSAERLRQEVADARLEEVRGPLFNALGAALHDMGRREEAEQFYLRALEVHRARGDTREEGITLGNLANTWRGLGRVEQAEQAFLRAIELHRRAGNERSMAIAFGNLANIYTARASYAQAEEVQLRAAEIHRRMGNQHLLVHVLGNLGGMLMHTGRHAQSEKVLQEAVELSERCGNWGALCHQLNQLALLRMRTEREAEALELLRRAIAIAREAGAGFPHAEVLANMGVCLAALGRIGGALGAYDAAIEASASGSPLRVAAGCVSLRARFGLLVGEVKEAQQALEALPARFGSAIAPQDYLDHVLVLKMRLELERAAGGDRQALVAARASLAEYDAVLVRQAVPANSDLHVNRQSLAEALAKAEGGALGALLGGETAADFSAPLAAGLFHYISKRQPKRFERLVRERPQIVAALERAAASVPEPDWRSEQRP